MEHDPALLFDAEGRLKLWEKESNDVTERNKTCCGKGNTEHEKDLIFVQKYEKYTNSMRKYLKSTLIH